MLTRAVTWALCAADSRPTRAAPDSERSEPRRVSFDRKNPTFDAPAAAVPRFFTDTVASKPVPGLNRAGGFETEATTRSGFPAARAVVVSSPCSNSTTTRSARSLGTREATDTPLRAFRGIVALLIRRKQDLSAGRLRSALLEAPGQVPHGDDAHQPLPVHDREVPEPPVQHDVESLAHRGVGGDGDGPRGHPPRDRASAARVGHAGQGP